jgi:hypothetical protein
MQSVPSLDGASRFGTEWGLCLRLVTTLAARPKFGAPCMHGGPSGRPARTRAAAGM